MKYDEFLNKLSLAAMQKSIDKSVNKLNSMPVDDFCGLSPNQVTTLTTRFGSPRCAVRLRDRIPDDVIDSVPIFRLVEAMLKMAAREGKLELTKLGFLKRKHLHELYAHGFISVSRIEEKISSLRNEWDWPAVDCARAVLELGRLTRRYKGNLVLTKLGKKMAAGPREALFRMAFEFLTIRIEWSDHGGPEGHGAIQDCVGYSFWLVSKFGSEWRPSDFYAKKFMTAFPMILPDYRARPVGGVIDDVIRLARNENPDLWDQADFQRSKQNEPAPLDLDSGSAKFVGVVYTIRTFFSYFVWLGMVEPRIRQYPDPPLLRKTGLFDRLIEIRL